LLFSPGCCLSLPGEKIKKRFSRLLSDEAAIDKLVGSLTIM
jgi:hypothetical protein